MVLDVCCRREVAHGADVNGEQENAKPEETDVDQSDKQTTPTWCIRVKLFGGALAVTMSFSSVPVHVRSELLKPAW